MTDNFYFQPGISRNSGIDVIRLLFGSEPRKLRQPVARQYATFFLMNLVAKIRQLLNMLLPKGTKSSSYAANF